MKKITQEEYDAMPITDDYKICPTGDYSDVKIFDDDAKFGSHTIFESHSVFGSYSRFGSHSTFGECSTFGAWSKFEAHLIFGSYSTFGHTSTFGEYAEFGSYAAFGNDAKFTGQTTFGHDTTFENGYLPINYMRPFMKFAGFGSRCNSELYYYQFTRGDYIRAGCWFGTVEEFRQRVIDEKADVRYLKLMDFLQSFKEK